MQRWNMWKVGNQKLLQLEHLGDCFGLLGGVFTFPDVYPSQLVSNDCIRQNEQNEQYAQDEKMSKWYLSR